MTDYWKYLLKRLGFSVVAVFILGLAVVELFCGGMF